MTPKPIPSSHHSRLDKGVENINVELWDPQDPEAAAKVISAFYHSTWGDLMNPMSDELPEDAWLMAQMAMAGQVLPNTLESLSVTFGISGISRATTHQLVRTRVGAVFGQQGGRDNNWSYFNLRVPATMSESEELLEDIIHMRKLANGIYEKAVRAGVPYQDARYILPMGLETNLVGSYNMLSVKSLLARRLCNRMMWETNYVARLMHDLLVRQYPWVGRSLRSSCEYRGVCQSVSPMFPNSCWTSDHDTGARLCIDNGTLQKTFNEEGGPEFMRYSNSAEAFAKSDEIRIRYETNHSGVVLSLIDPFRVLATKDSNGRWVSDNV